MTTNIKPAKANLAPSKGEGACFLVAMAVIFSDLPERLPFWPEGWAFAPTVGTTLLAVALILALVRFSRTDGSSTAPAR